MSKFPSGIALLGLIALSGFSEHDRIRDLLDRANEQSKIQPKDGAAVPLVESAFLADINSRFGEADLNSTFSGALTELDEIFAATGYANCFNSWIVEPGNCSITREELLDALGEEIVTGLSQKTGLTRDDVLFRLADALPSAINAISGPVHEVEAQR